MEFAGRSCQQIAYKQVTNGLLSGTFLAFQVAFVASLGQAQVLVTGTQHNDVVSKNSLGSKKTCTSLCVATSICHQLRCPVQERCFGQGRLCEELRCLPWRVFCWSGLVSGLCCVFVVVVGEAGGGKQRLASGRVRELLLD